MTICQSVVYTPQNIRIEKGNTKHTMRQTILRFQTENSAILLCFEYEEKVKNILQVAKSLICIS